jgi:hypothetical protein
MSYIAGKYYSNIITTGSAVVGQDLFDTIKTDLGLTKIIAKKLSLASSGSISIAINGDSFYSPLSDSSGSYALNLGADDVLASSLKVKESGRTVFISIIY